MSKLKRREREDDTQQHSAEEIRDSINDTPLAEQLDENLSDIDFEETEKEDYFNEDGDEDYD